MLWASIERFDIPRHETSTCHTCVWMLIYFSIQGAQIGGPMPNNASYLYGGTKLFAALRDTSVGMLHSADFPFPTLLTMNFGRGMGAPFYDWIQSSLKHGTSIDGSVVSLDYAGKILYWDDWRSGRVSEIVFPGVDAGSAASLTVNLSVQIASVEQRRLGPRDKFNPIQSGRQQVISSSNFRIQIGGLAACNYVSKVGSISVGGVGSGTGGSPELSLTIRESHATDFRNWLHSGNSPKTCCFQYLTPNLQGAIFVLNFQTVVIATITPAAPVNPNSSVTVKLRTSGFDFTAPGG